MGTRKIATNTTLLYILVFVIVVLAFLLLGGGPWVRGMMHESGSMGMNQWNWTQILISLAIGVLFGWAIFRRR